MKKTVLAFGEVLWDLLPTETALGGAVCNFIYRVNSLGDNGVIVSRLGKDELGEAACQRVSDLGLGTEYLQWDDRYPTGTVPVTFDDSNNPIFVILPNVAYDHIEMTHALREAASTDLASLRRERTCYCHCRIHLGAPCRCLRWVFLPAGADRPGR